MEVFTLTQWTINPSKKFSLITQFHIVLGMVRTLLLQEMTKKSLFMILLEMFCKDSTILMMRRSRTLLFAVSTHQDKVLLLEISTDFTFTISTKKEDNGKKLFAKTLRTIILSLLYAGKTTEVDLLQETFAVL